MPALLPLALRMTDRAVAFHSLRPLLEIRALPVGSRVRLVHFARRYVAIKESIQVPPPGAPPRANPIGWWRLVEA